MKKLIEIPDETLGQLKKMALVNNSRSVKKYMEDILIFHASKSRSKKLILNRSGK